MGVRCHKSRLQTGIFKDTSIFRRQANSSFSQKRKHYQRGNKHYVTKKCYRNCQSRPDKFRFLQHIISGTKKIRRNETSNQSEAPEQISPETTLQNGYIVESTKPCRERRLGIQNRFERCLFSYKNFQGPSKISKVSVSRSDLSIQSSLFRSNECSSSFCQSNISGASVLTKTQYTSSRLSRRLVNFKHKQNDVVERSISSDQSPISTRIYDKQDKITTCPGTGISLLGKSVGFQARDSPSKRRTTGKSEESSAQYSKRAVHGETFHDFVGNDCFMPRINTKLKVVHETDSTPCTKILEPSQNEFICKNTIDSRIDTGFELVLIGSEHWHGQIFSETAISNHTNHRCQWQTRLGGSHGQPYLPGSMVRVTENDAYQLPGNASSSFESSTFLEQGEGKECVDQMRQHDGLSIYQSSRGYKINTTMQYDSRPLAVGSEEQYTAEKCSYQGQTQSFSGQIEQDENLPVGMVIEQDSCVETVPNMGSSDDGPICNIPKQGDTTILLMDQSSSGICSRCTVNPMGECLCLCISTTTTSPTSAKSHAEVSLHNITNCKSVATATLLPAIAQSSHRQSDQTSMQPESTDSGSRSNISSPSRVSASDCMAVINRRWSSKGLSKKTRALLSKSWRSGTRKDYQSKFNRFNSWCSEREIDPYVASLSNCADFLTHLFHSGLKYRTINGYRSMLSSVLAPVDDIPVGKHPFIIRLLRAVFNERPPVKKLVPEWNLLLVLDCLKEAPFEPLKRASLRNLTWKVCFLLAITSFKRCSDLQSIKLGEQMVNVQRKGVTFIRTGLSKQDRPGHSDRTIFVPSLPENKLLDPKRALYRYLKRTEQLRDSESDKMFIATKKPHKPVSSQTISRWLVSVIKFCYKTKNKSVGKVKGHSTRSIGPSFALFKGASLQQIMESADWSRETTFTRHYLRNINTDYMNV